MRNKLMAFAAQYASEMERRGSDGDELRSINNPIVFLFLGDLTADAARQVAALNDKRWNNSAGVVYLHAAVSPVEARDNLYSWKLAVPVPEDDKRSVRPGMYRQFYAEEAGLLELNVLLRRMNNRVSEYGRTYANLQRLNLVVVTRADDPSNVLLPELTVLMKTVFGESFRSVLVDLYVLMEENQAGEDYAYQASLGVSFLRELDVYQSRTYRFHGLLQVTGEGVRLSVEHPSSPLFDTVYLLSDKDERGIVVDGGLQSCYELICSLNLLKNRKVLNRLDPEHGGYNHQQFKQSMVPPDKEGAYCVSAGFSKVTRPHQAIALTVLFHYYRHLLQRMKEYSGLDRLALLELLELTQQRWDQDISSLMPGYEKAMEGMYALLHSSVSSAELNSMTLRQAEHALYGGNARSFFEMNVIGAAETAFARSDFAGKLERLVESRVIGNALYGYYSLYHWTANGVPDRLTEELHERIDESSRLLEQYRAELEQRLEEPVGVLPQSKGSLFQWMSTKAAVKNLSRQLLDRVYGLKLEMLFLELKLKLLRGYLSRLEELHARAKPVVERLSQLEKQLLDISRGSISAAHDYLGRNIHEYYEHMVQTIVAELESRRDNRYYFDDLYVGNVSLLSIQDEELLLDRLIETARKDLFVHALFHQSFEDELLARANVTTSYERSEVLTKENLFHDLYRTLEEEGAIRTDVYNSSQQHRYEEKYFFGDFRSEFIRYAFGIDHGGRTYKLGCVHEEKTGGIEKLNLMGGFRTGDLMFYRNGRRYYDTYLENGYKFHAIEL